MDIRLIDMHHRDSLVLDFLRKNAIDNHIRISAETIADKIGCHPNTARAIIRRLERAGHLVVSERTYRNGFTYKI